MGTVPGGGCKCSSGRRDPHTENCMVWPRRQPSGCCRWSLPRSLSCRPQAPTMVCEAEFSSERVHGCKSRGSPTGTLFSLLTLVAPSVNVRWPLLFLCALNMFKVMEPLHAQNRFWVPRRQSCFCALSSCPVGGCQELRTPCEGGRSPPHLVPVSISLKIQSSFTCRAP